MIPSSMNALYFVITPPGKAASDTAAQLITRVVVVLRLITLDGAAG